MTRWMSLATRLGIGLAVAAFVIIIDDTLSLRFEPTLVFLIGAVVAAASWAFSYVQSPGGAPEWQQPSWHTRSPHFQADIRTRRLASVLAHSQPGQAFDSRRIARQLAEITARRLAASGRTPADDPLAHAEPHLSPALLTYLRSAEAEHTQVLNRRTLHAHLKEIDSL